MRMNISVIIPSRFDEKSRNFLEKCINSLKKSKANNLRIKICIVTSDNSTQKHFKSAQIIQARSNSGFSDMNNEAIEFALDTLHPDYILLINNDAWVNQDFFTQFQKILDEEEQADVVVPLVYESDGKSIDSFGVEYFRSGYAKNSREIELNTTLTSASCVIINSDFLKKMKITYGFYFNPLLFFYLEDVEFCIRAFMLGANYVKSKSLIAYHYGSTTSGKKSYFVIYQTYRNVIWVIMMTWTKKEILLNIMNILIVQVWLITYSLLHYGPILYLNILKETIVNFKNLLDYRRKIINNYSKNVMFASLFSEYAFRTFKNKTFRFF